MGPERDKHNDDRSLNEETAAELTPRLRTYPLRNEDQEDVDELTNMPLAPVREAANGSAFGITGLMLSIASLFFLPFLLSLFGIGAGFIAYRRGSTSLGRWAMGIGIVSFVSSMIFAPFLG